VSRSDGRLSVEWLGRVPYGEALSLQAKAVEDRRQGRSGDRLLLLEHPPVVTLGRSARASSLLVSREELVARGIEVHEAQRGGDVTYHAPGQLVGYPIVDLRARGNPDLHAFLRSIESALMRALGDFGLRTHRVEGRTGVFVEAANAGQRARKIASIGIGVRRWISFHGFAVNGSLDVAGFDVIVPCGLHDVEMTSLARELGRSDACVDQELRRSVSASFERELA